MESPFRCGKRVYGDLFIGRKADLEYIEARIIPNMPINLAIVGLRKIGKSSLVEQAFSVKYKDSLIKKNLVLVYIDLHTYATTADFFNALINTTFNTLNKISGLKIAPIKEFYLKITANNTVDEDYDTIKSFFQEIKDAGYKIICIIDGFDAACTLFQNKRVTFRRFRELSDSPQYDINYVIISCRTIREIEIQIGGNSNLYQMFGDNRRDIGMFTDDDLQEYFEKFRSLKIPISPEIQQKISFYCGGYPYLLALFGNEIVSAFSEKKTFDIDEIFRKTESTFVDIYEKILKFLDEIKLKEKFLEALFARKYSINGNQKTQLTQLINYGLLKMDVNQNYATFSAHFYQYLSEHNLACFSWDLIWTSFPEVPSMLNRVEKLDKNARVENHQKIPQKTKKSEKEEKRKK